MAPISARLNNCLEIGDCVKKINDDLSFVIQPEPKPSLSVSNVCGYYDTNSKNARPASYMVLPMSL